MRRFLLLCCLLLAACGGASSDLPPSTRDAVPPEMIGTHVRREFPMKPHYLAIDPAEVSDIAIESILFFAKTDDVFTKEYETLLKRLSLSGTLVVSVYRLEFRSSTGARLQYAAVTENTFVVLGKNRERLKSLVHPTLRELLFLVTGASAP